MKCKYILKKKKVCILYIKLGLLKNSNIQYKKVLLLSFVSRLNESETPTVATIPTKNSKSSSVQR